MFLIMLFLILPIIGKIFLRLLLATSMSSSPIQVLKKHKAYQTKFTYFVAIKSDDTKDLEKITCPENTQLRNKYLALDLQNSLI